MANSSGLAKHVLWSDWRERFIMKDNAHYQGSKAPTPEFLETLDKVMPDILAGQDFVYLFPSPLAWGGLHMEWRLADVPIEFDLEWAIDTGEMHIWAFHLGTMDCAAEDRIDAKSNIPEEIRKFVEAQKIKVM